MDGKCPVARQGNFLWKSERTRREDWAGGGLGFDGLCEGGVKGGTKT